MRNKPLKLGIDFERFSVKVAKELRLCAIGDNDLSETLLEWEDQLIMLGKLKLGIKTINILPLTLFYYWIVFQNWGCEKYVYFFVAVKINVSHTEKSVV